LLDARFLWTSKETWRRAKDEAVRLQPTREVRAMLKLCEEMGRVFEKYEHTLNKYYGGASPEVRRGELAQIEQELTELRKLLRIDEESVGKMPPNHAIQRTVQQRRSALLLPGR